MTPINPPNKLACFSKITRYAQSVLVPQLTMMISVMPTMTMTMMMILTGSRVSSSTLTRPRGRRKGKRTEMKPTAPTLVFNDDDDDDEDDSTNPG